MAALTGELWMENDIRYSCGAWWFNDKFSALRPKVEGSNPTLAVTQEPWASPSLAIACSSLVC